MAERRKVVVEILYIFIPLNTYLNNYHPSFQALVTTLAIKRENWHNMCITTKMSMLIAIKNANNPCHIRQNNLTRRYTFFAQQKYTRFHACPA